MVERILRDLKDGIDCYAAGKTTLNKAFQDYIEMKYELKDSTRCNYIYMWDKFIKDVIGGFEIGGVKYGDIKKFYISLIRERGLKPNSVENIHTLLHPVFASAVRDGLIRINPTDNVLAEIKKSHNWEKPKRHALTEKQQVRFITFVTGSTVYNHWLPLFMVLLGTGGRIGEILGLRWNDCDFDHGIININHNLIYRQIDNGKMAFSITTPKTKSGIRIIPMFFEVKRALLLEREHQKKIGGNGCAVGDYCGFIFQNRYHEMLNPHVVNRAIDRIVRDANLESGGVELPHFSVHNLRHTFCTRMCENEPNIKIIQEIMGHRNIETTMDVYNEATKEKKMESFSKLEGKILLGARHQF
jgi:integrase